MQEVILRAWRRKNAFFYLMLIPLSWLFALITGLRRLCYRKGLFKSRALPVPVIVVGNISLGGTGKTPVVIWLVEQLKLRGYKPGVISRGYGVETKLPISVSAESKASLVGDEPLLIAKRCACPVWICVNRFRAGEELLKAHPECNVIISDDGLQHYRLKRDMEIVVVNEPSQKDARLMPAGRLRESVSRLNTVDAVIFNGLCSRHGIIESAYEMQLVGKEFYNLANESMKATAADFDRKSVRAMAGIGNPELFFEYLSDLGLTFSSMSFEDHHAYSAKDLASIDCEALIMTEKDAVKCKLFAQPHYWVLPVKAQIDEALMLKVIEKIAKK